MPFKSRAIGIIFCSLLLWLPLTSARAGDLSKLPRDTSLTITATSFPIDDNRVLVGTREGTLALWDIATERQLRNFRGKKSSIIVTSLSSDGVWAFAANDAANLTLWQTTTGRSIKLPRFSKAKVEFAQLSGNGSLLVLGDADRVIYAVDTLKQSLLWKSKKPWPRPITALHLAPDGQRLLVQDTGGQPALYDFPSRALVCGGAHFDGLLPYSVAAAFSYDSQQFAVADGDFNVIIYNAKTCDRITTLRGHRNAISALAFSPDAKRLVSAGREAALKIWELADGTTLQTKPTLLAATTNVRFSPDGHLVSAWLVAEGTVWNFLQRWNVSSGASVDVSLPIVDSGNVETKMQHRVDEKIVSAITKTATFTSVEGGFSVSLPQSWTQSSARPTESGVRVTTHDMNDYPAHMIFSRIESIKEKIDTYQSPETFIRIFSRPVLSGWSEIGSEYGEVSDITVAGLPAKSFEKRVYEFVTPIGSGRDLEVGHRVFERMGKKVLTYHRYVVIPVTSGFYRLEYAAEDNESSRYMATFEAALTSFRLNCSSSTGDTTACGK